MKPLISIVIPTKGRVQCVNALTADLVSSVGYDRNKVSVTVLDNGTPNASYAIPNDVRLIARKQSVSAIENILSAASICWGRYSWIIGDDDAFARDIFARVFDLIDEFEPGIIRLKHQYIETDDIIRAYDLSLAPQGCQDGDQSFFDWHCFSPSGIKGFEDKSGFVSANIFRSDILQESLRISRTLVSPFVYARNIYVTKLYASLALCLAGGYWASNEILVKQRIPVNSRYFVENGSDWFQNFVEAPAEVYRAVARFDKAYSSLLLSIHYSKKVDYGQGVIADVSIFQSLSYIVKNLVHMGPRKGLRQLRQALFACIRRAFLVSKNISVKVCRVNSVLSYLVIRLFSS